MGSHQQVLLALGGVAAATDPSFSSVVQLMHMEGAHGSTTLTNSCSRGNTLGCGANASISTTAGDFTHGSAGLRRNGGLLGTSTAGSANHADYQFGTSDWTIEFRVKVNSALAAVTLLFDMRPSGADGLRVAIYATTAGGLVLYVNSAARITGANGSITTATFYAIAAARVSGTTRLFVNGTQVGANYTDGNNYNDTAAIAIGGAVNANPTDAAWDELRVTNGVGRYSGTYTPSATAFPDS